MERAPSPPLTPIRSYMSPIETSTSPSSQYREHLRRRTSSFSSNNDRSPTTPRDRHRFSNASQLSADFGMAGDEEPGGGNLGNLADELDQLSDEEYEEGVTEEGGDGMEDPSKEEISRDSGIDVSYANSSQSGSSHHVRNFSKPFGGNGDKPPDGHHEPEADRDEESAKFSSDLEDFMTTIARMTSYTTTSEDPLIPRTIAQLQDLGNQTSLEAAAQRLTTSTNSTTSHLNAQSKSLQTLAQSLYPMFAFSAPLDPGIAEETIPMVESLQEHVPHPDLLTVQKLQRLDRETADVLHALSQITDTLQMGKQITTTAARNLRQTQTMVIELRREQERAELARHELAKSDWDEKLQSRWCGTECKDIISGFEDQCKMLRGRLEESMEAGA
ncbi:uncharacterized protein RCC_02657 [Ramularia collo-cygni]|uniref:Uncharacterized protein n=1 Tax=Ramularia collo-cygni TaxID=112498 RepID=A0A2D3V8V6_9PEZI|nr:uncharacterized protein RCC_02657 [Ramularia collo-cygni]CZT16823.1 uncharacterized protein RCC_02657 [Ramularia collo-cygni]